MDTDTLPSLLLPLTEGARLKHISKDQVLFYQGDISTDIYVLKNGVVKIHDIDTQGNEKILHLVREPAIVPFAFFSGGSTPTHWFYTALTDCDVYEIPRIRLLSELQTSNDLMMYLMNWFSREVHEIMIRLNSLGKTNAENKLLAALQFLGTQYSTPLRGYWRRVDFPVSHQLLADMAGITRESAALSMKVLQDRKFIRSPHVGTLEINLAKLGR
jgi:CRP/FNR family transcriptional regulator